MRATADGRAKRPTSSARRVTVIALTALSLLGVGCLGWIGGLVVRTRLQSSAVELRLVNAGTAPLTSLSVSSGGVTYAVDAIPPGKGYSAVFESRTAERFGATVAAAGDTLVTVPASELDSAIRAVVELGTTDGTPALHLSTQKRYWPFPFEWSVFLER